MMMYMMPAVFTFMMLFPAGGLGVHMLLKPGSNRAAAPRSNGTQKAKAGLAPGGVIEGARKGCLKVAAAGRPPTLSEGKARVRGY
jgi:hypothetical protein